jgi:hypothetical protein
MRVGSSCQYLLQNAHDHQLDCDLAPVQDAVQVSISQLLVCFTCLVNDSQAMRQRIRMLVACSGASSCWYCLPQISTTASSSRQKHSVNPHHGMFCACADAPRQIREARTSLAPSSLRQARWAGHWCSLCHCIILIEILPYRQTPCPQLPESTARAFSHWPEWPPGLLV